jgi:hypothetical protein
MLARAVMMIRQQVGIVIVGGASRGHASCGESFSGHDTNDGCRDTAKCEQETATARVEDAILHDGAIAAVSRIPHDLVLKLLPHVRVGHMPSFVVLKLMAPRVCPNWRKSKGYVLFF